MADSRSDLDDMSLRPGSGSTARSEQHDILFAIVAHQHRFIKRELLIPALAEWKQNVEQPSQ